MVCFVTVNGLWHFLTVPYVGPQCVILVFPDHTHFVYHVRHVLYGGEFYSLTEIFCRLSIFFPITSFRNTISETNSLDPDQAHKVIWHRISTDDSTHATNVAEIEFNQSLRRS